MILLIDKPKGWTSFDVVAKVRGMLRETDGKKIKVGHAGTLDPNATGLLIIGTGTDTKKLGEITKNTKKTYEAEIVLGATSDTGDVVGTISVKENIKEPDIVEIKQILKSFEGEQMQTPPIYSAIKIKGKKSYDLARQGKEVKLTPRKITIYKIEFNEYEYPTLKITCEVSSGTYIRSLASDIGENLGTGAYLSNLYRTQVGEYMVQKAVTLQELQQLLKEGQLQH